MKKLIFSVFALFFIGFQANAQKLPHVKMETDLGNIWFEIDTIHAPITATNFLNHVKTGTFSDAIFYRVVRMDNQPKNDIKIEVIQGGILSEERLKEIPGIPHETTQQTGLKHINGTLSMARSEPGSASTEFFICIGNQPELDFGGKRNPDGQGFAAFGKVINGMDVVKKIQKQIDRNQMLVKPVNIRTMVIFE